MTAASGDSAAETPRKVLPLRFLQAVTFYWIALKVSALFLGEPHADEAYYFIWGQHLALSYFDHAPLHGWLQGLMELLFGWTVFGLRFLSIVTTAITMYLLYLWSKRLAQDDWKHTFWLSTALFYSTPLMLFYTTVAVHDRVLVAMELLSLHFFVWFFADWAEGRRDRLWALYLGALFLGFATLTKYNGALIGVGVAAAILARRDLRSLFGSPHLYLAAALSVAMQFPVLYWNLTEGFASAQFHLGPGRTNPFDLQRINPGITAIFAVESLLLLSPVAIAGMALLVVRPARDGFGGILHSVAKGVFLASTAFAVFLSLTRYVLFYWNIVAYAAFFALAPLFIRSRAAQLFQIGYGMVLGTVLMVQFTIFPVLQAVGIESSHSDGLFGWQRIAAEVRAAEEQYDAGFAAAVTWGMASRLGFALGSGDVPALTETTDGYDFWVNKADYAGKDAIILTEHGDEEFLDDLRAHFDSIEQVGIVVTEQFGVRMHEYQLHLARNYRPD